MKEKYIALFNLTVDSSLEDIKKAYRKLAKQNHPDGFSDPKQKRKCEKRMSFINEAYRVIVADFAEIKKKLSGKAKREIENDFALYKNALEYYSLYFDSFFELFSRRAVHTIEEKEKVLSQSRVLFAQLITEYPDSDWVYDSEKKLEKIDQALKDLENAKRTYKAMGLNESKY